MPRFNIEFAKEWTEHGTATIEAADMDEARSLAEEMLTDSDDDIEWNGSNMDPGQERVESVTEAEHE